jgi:predicted nucleic acid-binding Zn ribbon protein
MERIEKSVEHVLSRTGGGTALALAEITAAWPEVVGKAVSREAWPLRVARDGTLHVATSSSTWAFELDRLSPEIGERLRARMGPTAPAKFRFRVGPVPEHGRLSEDETSASRAAPQVTPQVDSEAAAVAAEIDDPELRGLVSRAARASLARARSGRRF